jgi:uncharacterized protein (TIGR01777 family)
VSPTGPRRFTSSTALPVAATEAFAWHTRAGAFERLVPPWEAVRVLERGDGLDNGSFVVLELRRGPFRRRWVARHHDVVPGASFSDTMEKGPFAEWTHVHRFVDAPGGTGRLSDEVDYRLPFGLLARPAGPYVERTLRRSFAFRHRRLVHDLSRHRATSGALRVAVIGPYGLIGSALCAFLTSGGHEVVRVSRSPRHSADARVSPAGEVEDPGRLEGLDAVVHLAGESISRRWTRDRKQEIERSRIEGTRALAETLARLESPPGVLVSASAVGFYGDRGDELLTEENTPGSDFLAQVCTRWEAATSPARDAGIRVVTPRFGVVLEALLQRMLVPFQLGLGGPVGSGRQWVSWVALDDLLGALLRALTDDSLAGPVNIVAPGAATNAELARTLGAVLGRPARMRIPAFAARLLFGELADGLLLASQHAVPTVLTASGFEFAYPTLEDALGHLLGREWPRP